ncbi:MAG: hypothetical protein C0501_04875 [Isosphaera sp.]|nr:hypothetical protein [Isosphaera sp.]
MRSQVTGMWAYRHFLLALVRLDLRQRYQRSALGLGWTLVQPLAMAATFVFVFSGVLGMSPATYTTTLLVGLAVWGFLKESAVGGCSALVENESYIRQCPLPYGLYPLRLVLGYAIHAALALMVAALAVVLTDGHAGKLRLLWAVAPALLMILAAGWAVATVFSFAQVYFHDTKHLLEVGAQILFFLTPIIYPPDVLVNKGLGWLVRLNPVNLYLELVRRPLTTGELPDAKLYLYAAALTAALVGVAFAAVATLRKRVAIHL